MLRIFEWRFAENILLRAVGKLVYLIAWIVGLAVAGAIVLWALKAFGVIDVFATISQLRARIGLTDWKKTAGSAVGVIFLGWLAWSVIDSPPSGSGNYSNSQQNYYNRRNVTYVDRREMRRMERQQDRRDRRDRSNIDRCDGL